MTTLELPKPIVGSVVTTAGILEVVLITAETELKINVEMLLFKVEVVALEVGEYDVCVFELGCGALETIEVTAAVTVFRLTTTALLLHPIASSLPSAQS